MSFTNLEPGVLLGKVEVVLDKGDRDPQFGGDPADIEISVTVADDGAVLIFIDTVNFEPDGTKVRVNINDGPVFGYDDDEAKLMVEATNEDGHVYERHTVSLAQVGSVAHANLKEFPNDTAVVRLAHG